MPKIEDKSQGKAHLYLIKYFMHNSDIILKNLFF